MTEAEQIAALLPWECFQYAALYDMWCVRPVGDRTFGQGFHLATGDEAKALTALLNTRTDAALTAEHDVLREALVTAMIPIEAILLSGADAAHCQGVCDALRDARATTRAALKTMEGGEMKTKGMIFGAVAYALVAVVTFGHSAAAAEKANNAVYAECSRDPKNFCFLDRSAGLNGFLAGMLWPLYWSWEVFS